MKSFDEEYKKERRVVDHHFGKEKNISFLFVFSTKWPFLRYDSPTTYYYFCVEPNCTLHLARFYWYEPNPKIVTIYPDEIKKITCGKNYGFMAMFSLFFGLGITYFYSLITNEWSFSPESILFWILASLFIFMPYCAFFPVIVIRIKTTYTKKYKLHFTDFPFALRRHTELMEIKKIIRCFHSIQRK